MQRTDSQDSGRRASLRGLLLLNVLLLAVLGAVTFGPGAEAQLRLRGEYFMVAGNVKGTQGGVVYVVDGTNEELIAVTYDATAKDLAGLGYRSLAADAINVGAARN